MSVFRRPFKLILLFFTVLPLITAMPDTAFAKKTTKQEAEKVKALFQDIIEEYTSASEAAGAKLITEGEVLVEQDKTYYAVTMPHMKLQNSDGTSTEIGMIATNVMPAEVEGQWKMTIAVPTPVTLLDGNGQPLVITKLGSQSTVGVWHEKLGNFIKLNATFSDINAFDNAKNTNITVKDAKIIYDLSEGENGLWSGPAKFQFSDFNMDFQASGASAHVDEVVIDSYMKDYSIDEVVKYKDTMEALAESAESDDPQSASGAHLVGIYNTLFSFVSNAWDSFSFNATVKGFNLKRPPIPGSPAGHFQIENARFGLGFSGFRSGSVEMKLDVGYNELVFEPQPKDVAAITPTRLKLDLSVKNLPYKQLMESAGQSLTATTKHPQMAKMAALGALAQVPVMLSSAQTHTTLTDSGFGNEKYGFKTDAKVTADMGAAKAATGDAQAVVSGFDYLTTNIKSGLASPNIPEDKKPHLQNLLRTLTLMKLIGKETEDPDARSFDLKLEKDGSIILNGENLADILASP